MANMNAAESNAALIISGYEAFSRGDIQSVLAVFAEDILWHVPGRGPLSRDYRGHTEVLGFFDISCGCLMAPSGFKSTKCLPRATGSSFCARKPHSAAVEVGLLRRFTCGR